MQTRTRRDRCRRSGAEQPLEFGGQEGAAAGVERGADDAPVQHQSPVGKTEDILQESAEEESFSVLLGMLNRRMHTELEIKRKLYKKAFSKETLISFRRNGKSDK